MATILSIIKQFCWRKNLPAPTAVVGVNTPTEQQYLSLLKEIGDDLRNRPFQWPQLKRTYSFLTVTDQTNYQLPGDFYRTLDSTQWDVTNQWPLNGPISDYNMTVLQYSVIGVQPWKSFRILGPVNYIHATSPFQMTSRGWFQINPAGANDTDELAIGYLSTNWLWPRNWVANTVYAANTIITGNGYTYFTAAGGTSGATRPSVSTGTVVDGTVTWRVWHEEYPCDPIGNGNLNDNDIILFDEDLMINGMIWAFERNKGQPFQDKRQDWENQVRSAFARFNGPTRISMAGDAFSEYGDFPLVSPGSWPV